MTRSLLIGVLTALLVVAPVARADPAPATVAGKPLVQVLRDVNVAGLRIVFSESLVPPDAIVQRDPVAIEPLARLREILAPFALDVQTVAPGTYVVVRGASQAPAVVLDPAPPSTAPIEEIRVIASRYSIEAARADAPLSVGAADLQRQPALLDDAVRSIRRFPGTAGSTVSSHTYVRGGLADENLVLLDGVPLQEPFHLQGLPVDFSLLDPALLERVDLYSGVMPIEYGSRMSAVLDMHTRRAADRFGGRVAVGTMSASALLEGTLPGGHGDWLAFGRRSMLDVVAKLIEPELGSPRVTDALGRVNLRLGEHNTLTFGTLTSDDDIEIELETEGERSRGDSTRNYQWLALETRWTGGSVRTLLTHTESVLERHAQLSDLAGSTGSLEDESNTSAVMLRQDWTLAPAPTTTLRFGFSGRRDLVDFEYDRDVQFAPGVAALFGRPLVSSAAAEPMAESHEYEAYAGASRELGARWQAEAGVHWNRAEYSTGQRQSAWDPRAGLLFRMSPLTRVRLTAGTMTQMWSAQELPVELDRDRFDPFSRTATQVLGFEHDFEGGAALRIEAFHKRVHAPRPRRENLLYPLTLVPELGADEVVLRASSARIHGVDVYFGGRLRGAVDTWLSYSWSQARDVIDGREVPRSWDQRHALGLGAAFDWRRWALSGTVTARSAWPTTPVLATSSALGLSIGERNAERKGLYFTLDLKAERAFDMPVGTLRLAVEASNVTDRDNFCCRELTVTALPGGGTSARVRRAEWLPIIPYATVSWEF